MPELRSEYKTGEGNNNSIHWEHRDFLRVIKVLLFTFWSKDGVELSSKKKKTSDAGLQYCCGLVGRGSQTPIHTQCPTQHRHIQTQNTSFPTFRLMLTNGPTDQWTDRWTDGWMDGWTDIASYRVACPRLKSRKKKFIWSTSRASDLSEKNQTEGWTDRKTNK